MKIDSFMPVRIISGCGALADAAEAIAALGNTCMIVTGGSSAMRSGALADAQKILGEKGIRTEIFDRVEPNPLTSTCHEAGRIAREAGVDFLIGIGGGSPLDAVKAVAIYASNADFAPEDIYTRRASANKPLPTVLIGTTSGTGSEVTGVSVLTNALDGRKKSVSGANCYADIAVCDYRYTMSMPYSVTVGTVLDAFAHASESYLSLAANDLSALYALKALPMIWEGLLMLEKTKTVPDEAMREQLYLGSLYAGLAINITGTLFPHAVGYVLTEEKGIPHGKACAAFAPVLFDRYKKYAPEKLAVLEKTLQADKTTILQTIANLADVKALFTAEQADRIAKRWEGATVNNFIRTPGGFDFADGAAALSSL